MANKERKTHPRPFHWHPRRFRLLLWLIYYFPWQRGMKAFQLGSIITNILLLALQEGPFETRARWHIDLMDLSANCSSRLSARVSDLHLVFLSTCGSGWVDTDTADEITRPSMQPFRWHWSVLCSVLLWWSHKSPNHWPMKHLFMAHFASGSTAAETWADRQCVDAVFPAADAEIKNLVAVCVTRLSWYFEYYQLSFMLAQTERGSLRKPWEGSVQNRQGRSRYSSPVWAFGEEKTAEGKRNKLSLISPSLSHVGYIMPDFCMSNQTARKWKSLQATTNARFGAFAGKCFFKMEVIKPNIFFSLLSYEGNKIKFLSCTDWFWVWSEVSALGKTSKKL